VAVIKIYNNEPREKDPDAEEGESLSPNYRKRYNNKKKPQRR